MCNVPNMNRMKYLNESNKLFKYVKYNNVFFIKILTFSNNIFLSGG